MSQHATDRKWTVSGSGQKSAQKKFFFGSKTGRLKLKSKIGFLAFDSRRSHQAGKLKNWLQDYFQRKTLVQNFFLPLKKNFFFARVRMPVQGKENRIFGIGLPAFVRVDNFVELWIG
jgi:hypothetical protein